MFRSKPLSESVFYGFMIIVCLAVAIFMVKLLGCDDSKYNPKSNVLQYEGRITEYREIKGDFYFKLEGLKNVEFKTDLWSLISKEDFEEKVQNDAVFKISYSNNTLHENQCEVLTLSSEETVMISQASRAKAVTSNIIIYGIGLAIAVIGLLYFSFGFIK